jgi:glycine oxidase
MPFDTTPVRGQIVQFRSSRPKLRHVIESELGYLVPRRDGRVLAGSTSENVGFDSSTTKDGVAQLAAMAGQLVPSLREAPLTGRWAGLRPFVADGLPVLGEIDGIEGLFIATAHYRNGILLAPITAKLAAERLADGQRSSYLELFGPGRFQGRYAGAN